MDYATTGRGKRIIFFLTFKFAPLLVNARLQFILLDLRCLYYNISQLCMELFI